MSTTTTALKQIVVYVPEDLYQELAEIKASDRRMSFSYIGERLFRHALPAIKKELMPSFHKPAREAHGKKHRTA